MAEESQDLSPDLGVNTDQGFQAALAEKGLGPASLEPEGPASDRLIDEGTLPGEQEAEAPAEAAGEAEAEQIDPAVAEYISQHGGDEKAALAALVSERENAQGLIGRQGNELGDLRQQLARLEGRLDEAVRPAAEVQAPAELITPEVVDGISTMFDERGANGAMDWLAENRPDLIETGIQVWAESDPFQAGRFASRYDQFLQEEQAREQMQAQPAQPEPITDPVLAQMRAREQFTMLADGARQQLQIADEAWPTVRDQVVAAFNDETTSPLIKNAIISPDPGTQFEGMKAIVSLAQQRAIQAQSTAAESQAQAQAADEAEQRKLGATVTTGSLRPAPEGKSVEEMTSEERIALFKQSLLAAPSTSVLQGLTGLS